MHEGSRRFVSLADVLCMPAAGAMLPSAAVEPELSPASPAAFEPSGSPEPSREPHGDADCRAAVREARLFRAALSEAFEDALATLVGRLAIEVVARELRLAPADIAALARRTIADWQAEVPLRLRVAPADASVVCELPVAVDDGLQTGDAIIECRSGSIDARLGVRLAAVLASASA